MLHLLKINIISFSLENVSSLDQYCHIYLTSHLCPFLFQRGVEFIFSLFDLVLLLCISCWTLYTLLHGMLTVIFVSYLFGGIIYVAHD